MARVDLNAKRAARTEAEQTPHEITLGFDDEGNPETYRLRPLMPLEFTDLLSAGKSGAAMQLLLVDPADWQRMRRHIPDEADLLAIAELYGVDLPEASGSADSSPSTGTTSKPTSPTTTPASPPSPSSATAPAPAA